VACEADGDGAWKLVVEHGDAAGGCAATTPCRTRDRFGADGHCAPVDGAACAGAPPARTESCDAGPPEYDALRYRFDATRDCAGAPSRVYKVSADGACHDVPWDSPDGPDRSFACDVGADGRAELTMADCNRTTGARAAPTQAFALGECYNDDPDGNATGSTRYTSSAATCGGPSPAPTAPTRAPTPAPVAIHFARGDNDDDFLGLGLDLDPTAVAALGGAVAAAVVAAVAVFACVSRRRAARRAAERDGEPVPYAPLGEHVEDEPEGEGDAADPAWETRSRASSRGAELTEL
jgi:hypothetical protein